MDIGSVPVDAWNNEASHIYAISLTGQVSDATCAYPAKCYTLQAAPGKRRLFLLGFCKQDTHSILFCLFNMRGFNLSSLVLLLLSIALGLALPTMEEASSLAPRTRFCANSPHTVAGT